MEISEVSKVKDIFSCCDCVESGMKERGSPHPPGPLLYPVQRSETPKSLPYNLGGVKGVRI